MPRVLSKTNAISVEVGVSAVSCVLRGGYLACVDLREGKRKAYLGNAEPQSRLYSRTAGR